MKLSRRGKLLTALFGAVILLGVGGFSAGTLAEEHDDFCTACHTKPEVTYYDRTQQALRAKVGAADLKALAAQDVAIDLASQHYIVTETTTCIACHGGNRGLGDRVESLALGLKDTVVQLTAQADPTIEKASTGDPALINRACVSCHVDTLVKASFDNHFHVKLPQTWALIQSGVQPIVPAESPNALTDLRTKPELLETTVTCLSCHQAHRSNLDITKYLDQDNVVLPACAQCHQETGRGPVGIAPQ
jgi:predicted CXXCH cytochrome family protein